jgi:hypothetical protein
MAGYLLRPISPPSRFIVEYNREWSFSKAKPAKNTELFCEIQEVSWAFKQGGICTLKSSMIDSPGDKS